MKIAGVLNRWLNLLLFLIFATPVAISFALTQKEIQEIPFRCLFRTLTNHECPSCGLTRSFVAVAHGRLKDAVLFHPGGPVLFALFALLSLALLLEMLHLETPLQRFGKNRPHLPVVVGITALFEGYLLKVLIK
ncbi:MAG: hypothetical protein DRP63_04155 [Planctomycetota bacterium]|nr:MAG: hypothetical protein DRP63_04155 [Planctomycetota bacterium]